MTPELKHKISEMNEILRTYQRGLCTESEFKQALAEYQDKNFWPWGLSSYQLCMIDNQLNLGFECNKPENHNNADNCGCAECIVKRNDL